MDKEYKIPEFKIPNRIKEEIENEQKEEEEKKLIYEENKNNNTNPNENINKIVNDIRKNNEEDFDEISIDKNAKEKEEDMEKYLK